VTFVGAQLFNILNHPHFDQPNADIPSSQFGTITSSVSSPTSIFGFAATDSVAGEDHVLGQARSQMRAALPQGPLVFAIADHWKVGFALCAVDYLIKPLHKPASGSEFGSISPSKGRNIDEIFT
jgi:hypothetical protein